MLSLAGDAKCKMSKLYYLPCNYQAVVGNRRCVVRSLVSMFFFLGTCSVGGENYNYYVVIGSSPLFELDWW
jgi:hypothetical protein